MTKKAMFPLVFAMLIFLSACGSAEVTEPVNSPAESSQTTSVESVSVKSSTDLFTDRDMEIGYDEENSARIILSGDSASSESDAVQISGSTITITEEGTYILSGTLNDGMIVVDAEDTDKIQLVLNGIQITNSTSAAIYVPDADKVFITTASGTENTLSNTGEYITMDDNNIDAVVFSKADLTLNGAGMLTVTAAAGHGIVSKDDLVLTSGTYYITAASHGISGQDSVRIANGSYTISSGKDGIHAENKDDTNLGFLYVTGGTFSITTEGDGVSASAYLQIEAGDFTIATGEGSASVTMTKDAMGFKTGERFPTETAATEETDSVSQKGIKADGMIIIAGGQFELDTADDSIHAGEDILIEDGKFSLRSGDDGMHSDAAVTIQNGIYSIPYCYEGIEGLSVTVEDGTFDITAFDDGINAAGGADSSGFGGGRPGADQFSSSSESFIIINGGVFTIISDGDCIDSNGALTINGGTLDLTCNGNGNTALDCDGTYTNNGGDVTTNDGTESNPGQKGGGNGGPGQRGGGNGEPGQKGGGNGGPGQRGGGNGEPGQRGGETGSSGASMQ